MKKWKSYFLAVIAAICMLWIFPEHTPAATNEAVISVEKGTLGQGYIIEPTAVTLQSGDTVKTVTERVLEANGRSALTRTESYGYYIAGISAHTGTIYREYQIRTEARSQFLRLYSR